VARRQVLYPATPAWWASVEVPHGMAAQVSQMVGLQGSQLMEETLRSPYHIILTTLWAVEVAEVVAVLDTTTLVRRPAEVTS